MNVIPDPALDGLLLLEPRIFHDERGYFLESFRQSWFEEAGVDVTFVQANHSRSSINSVRGLHFQSPPGQPKFVRCTRGKIWDVAVDIRHDSPTQGRWKAFELSEENFRMLYIPGGFAHGFAVLSETADVQYMCGTYYDPAVECGIAWDDPELAVEWPVDSPVLSKRDQSNPSWETVREQLALGANS